MRAMWASRVNRSGSRTVGKRMRAEERALDRNNFSVKNRTRAKTRRRKEKTNSSLHSPALILLPTIPKYSELFGGKKMWGKKIRIRATRLEATHRFIFACLCVSAWFWRLLFSFCQTTQQRVRLGGYVNELSRALRLNV